MNKQITKGTKIFRITFASFIALLMLVIAFGLHYLWNFLAAYEKSFPELAADDLIAQINNDKQSYFDKMNFVINEFETEEAAKRYFKEFLNGEITYQRNGKQSDENVTVYDLKIDKNKIGQAVVKRSDEEIGSGFYKYKVDNVTINEVKYSEYSITAPSNVKVMCNGKELSEKYITSKQKPYENTANFKNYASGFPYDVTYTIGGFIEKPIFTAKDIFERELELSDEKFMLKNIKNEELSNLALNFSKAYSCYIVADARFADVAQYLLSNTKLYENLYGYENRWSRAHIGYDFLDIKVGDSLFYTENAAVVNLTYDHVLYNVPNTEKNEFHSRADFDVYMVKTGGQWKVVEMIINNR